MAKLLWTNCIRWFFNVLCFCYVLIPALLEQLRFGGKSGGMSSLKHRIFGVVPTNHSPQRPLLWLHALNVGEVLLLRPVIQQLLERMEGANVIVSTRTPSGLFVARNRLPRWRSFLAPFDFSWAARRTIGILRPQCIVITELELRPNLLLEAQRQEIPVAIINCSVADSDLAHLRMLRSALRPAFRAVHWWGIQTAEHAAKLQELFWPQPGQFQITGSIKFDAAVHSRDLATTKRLRSLFGFANGERILVAGSTHFPEEEIVIDAFEKLRLKYDDLRLVIVPHFLSSCERSESLLRGRSLAYAKRTLCSSPRATSAPVTLVDSIGELDAVWGLANFAFVGGSFSGRGGQNMLEPAALGVPLCAGPDIWNFEHIFSGLVACGGAEPLKVSADLYVAIHRFLENPVEARRMGDNAARFVRSQCGAAGLTARAIGEIVVKCAAPKP